MRRPHALTIVLVLAAAGAVRAQEPAPTPLTLEDAVQRAMATSGRLAEALARQRGATASIRAREASNDPSIAISGGYTRTNHVDEFGVPQPNGVLRVIYPDVPDNYFTRASLQWPIFDAGRTDALVRAAEAEARATAADVEVARADLRLEVERAYWALVTATATVDVLEEALARADAHLRDMRSQFEAGLVPPNEVTAVERERARQEVQLIEARNLRLSVQQDLRRLTGMTGDIVPAEALQETATRQAFAGTPDQGVDGSQRAERRALAERIAASEERVAAIAAGAKPTVAVHGVADYANPNPRIFPRADVWRSSWEFGVTATWTLWDSGRRAADRAEARAAVDALRARQSELDAVIAAEVRQRELDLESARAAVVAAETGVRSAQDTRRVVVERFNVGVATSTDVLDAEVGLLQAELNRTRALANVRLAEARLRRALGEQ